MRLLPRTAFLAPLALLGVALALCVPALTAADEAPEEPLAGEAELLAFETGDPMDAFLVAQRIGDAAIEDALTRPGVSAEIRLAAVRVAPFARQPERVLRPLVELAHTTDPAIAPAAVVAAHHIARTLRFRDLDALEVGADALEPPIARLRELVAEGEDEDVRARGDLVTLAESAAAHLDWLVRGGNEPE